MQPRVKKGKEKDLELGLGVTAPLEVPAVSEGTAAFACIQPVFLPLPTMLAGIASYCEVREQLIFF